VLVETRSLLKVESACSLLGYEVRLVREPEIPGANLAASLGYADQAHFVRDFKAVTGVPPEAHRRRQNR
jgi:AraC-like DNA-binding protein